MKRTDKVLRLPTRYGVIVRRGFIGALLLGVEKIREVSVKERNRGREVGLFPRKRLGQHFLVDRNAMEKVLRVADLDHEDSVLEIGPGRGDMTVLLARRSRRVIAVEIDKDLAAAVFQKTAPLGNVDVIQADALEIDLEQICRRTGGRVKVVANLPYQISTPLLMRFIGMRRLLDSMTLMIQKELAHRIVADPGTKAYGSLSVFVQLYTTPTIEMLLTPKSFFPRPRVDSALVRFLVHDAPRINIYDEKIFRRVVRSSFGQRRKVLKNALKTVLSKGRPIDEIQAVMGDLGIDPKRRAETLSIEEFARLAEGLQPYLSSEKDHGKSVKW